jgi:hypothetical protein
MIRIIRVSGGEAVPQLCCDVCLGPVNTVDLAMAIWFEDLDRKGQSTALYVVHKGLCDEKLQLQNGSNGGWHELRHGFELMMGRLKLRYHEDGKSFRPVVFEGLESIPESH